MIAGVCRLKLDIIMIKPTIVTLAGHSALEIFHGAKKKQFKTLALVMKGRDKTYTRYYRNLIDDFLLLDHFKDLNSKATQKLLTGNLIFIPHRYVQVYCDLDRFEKDFKLPVFGNRRLLKYEEREGRFNQYQILQESGINFPKQYKEAKDIDRLVLVKVKEKERRYERAFFFAESFADFKSASAKLLKQGKITKKDLQEAVIEEFVLGAQVNFNFFYSPLACRLELIGTDSRRQTNLDGLIRLPSVWQAKILKLQNPSYIESGHISVTVKESLLEKAFAMAEKILAACRKIAPPGIIGPFALQTAITAGPPAEEIVTFDLSLRIPGSPGTGFTPYSGYLFGHSLTFGDRIIMEIEKAIKLNKLKEITS
ncbi:MAG: 5-formaminoimidazole-4-carboxamide-1-(beta)-D-ribofuranosyl 5'-monophosphate synthetase-like protein, 5-formaminoimidazole-4-carboxamide-1-(beta)-D-ribofuranosyl 5'-monophosphate synthetase [Candidatus Gottesmanbacteria bacterium GW2011_GWA2_43_14]|uniref:5-formaminoimidazole-4-carboxamide-1-(Beta)-D-ribofuranosyl 5'-monophosphate synthetase-like protein, 5-formaminoimidazole-4-carboxamide-1-(Beta)-D-ribofuranosyl 5'-monophosphate synthetase n=1 Tax=Candidatus Gottesmanbacteria bacterium GW2011_GWA2_43_14 TaxID=1618443 RepID=A0A0G1GI64_9BACT|nr:MAG: 5-formaminoimidazole-4-carboxamide-1-(beta)-D-ribofuranosyl 5'-monophosphate synthetase-like protein, 5-formaminoimidazole-4-carboxamide-1-(beta)-D-ribofuranosyl 5'-monophosphate synthetase [Candidatus Gottesmanbacteria bacterium GW2011_GWA2_43_14]